MRFDETDLVRLYAGQFLGVKQGAHLSLDAGLIDRPHFTVASTPYAFNYSIDVVAITLCIFQTF